MFCSRGSDVDDGSSSSSTPEEVEGSPQHASAAQYSAIVGTTHIAGEDGEQDLDALDAELGFSKQQKIERWIMELDTPRGPDPRLAHFRPNLIDAQPPPPGDGEQSQTVATNEDARNPLQVISDSDDAGAKTTTASGGGTGSGTIESRHDSSSIAVRDSRFSSGSSEGGTAKYESMKSSREQPPMMAPLVVDRPAHPA